MAKCDRNGNGILIMIATASPTSSAVEYVASPIAIDRDTRRKEERIEEDAISNSEPTTALSTVAVEVAESYIN